MDTLKKMLRFSRPYWKQQVLALLFSTLEIVAFLLFPYVVKILIDEVFIKKNIVLFPKVILFYILLVIIIIFFEFSKTIIYKKLDEKVVRDSRSFLYKHLREMEFKHLHDYKTGELMSYFTNDVPKMTSILTSSVVELIQNLIRITCAVIVLSIINLKILLLILLLLPAYLLTVFIFSKPIRNSTKDMQMQNANISEVLQENLLGTHEILVFNRKAWDYKKIEEAFTRYIKYAVRNTLWITASNESGILIYWLAQILIYFIGGQYVLRDAMTIGTLLLYVQYMDNIYMPARTLLNFNNDIQQAIASGERYFNLIKDTSTDMGYEKPLKRSLIGFNNKIVFNNVSFKYENELVLEGLNFEIEKGEAVAIVGTSGAGKSTLIKLLLNLYKPTSGEIFLDSMDIKTITNECLYELISVIFQDPFLFSDTICNNIKFSNSDATDEEVKNAAQLAGAESFIDSMDKGYDSEIGEMGSKLSGGQKQRIAIARGILKNASIYIFDEATSSLDIENQSLINTTINRLKTQEKTVISITHNYDNITNMDKIIVLKDGKIEAIGRHSKLIETSDTYRQLFSSDSNATRI